MLFEHQGHQPKQFLMAHKKSKPFSSIYSNMHNGIKPHAEKITKDNVYQLFNMSFVFCVSIMMRQEL